jgi:hypothetical protein
MTLRSVILGALGGVVICAACFFNDFVINQRMLIPHQMPAVLYGSLILGVLGGMLARRCGGRRGWALAGAEWAVIAALGLVACGIPGWGLVQNLVPTAIMTHHYARLEPSWRSDGVDVVKAVPKAMLVDLSGDDGTVLDGYVRGLSEGDQRIGVAAVPWRAWAGLLRFWLPYVLALTMAVCGLALVLHQQWAHHEALPYPISVFAHALLPGEDGSAAPVFRSRLFYLGAGFVFLVEMNNYLVQWFSDSLIPVKLNLDLTPAYPFLPFLNGPGFYYELSFPVLGLAYFLRSSVALSVGLVPYLYTGAALLLAGYGVSLTGGAHLGANYNTFLFAGGYVGVLLLMLYTGRHYYWNALLLGFFFPVAGEAPSPVLRLRRAAGFAGLGLVLLRCVTGAGWLAAGAGAGGLLALHYGWAGKLPAASAVGAGAAWGVRVFAAGMLAVLALLVSVGLEWPFAVAFAGITVTTFVVVSRVVAETGAFHFGTFFLPGPLLMGFMGAAAVGPRAMLIMSLASSAILLAPGWAPMPFMVQALKLVDMAKVGVLGTARRAVLLVLVFVPVAVACTLYWSYDRGAPLGNWPVAANQYPGRDFVTNTQRLAGQGDLELADTLHGWSRLGHLQPDGPRVAAFLTTAGLALLCGWCSLRLTWWPFHPVMFLFLGSFHGQWISVSLLLGCLLKVGVIRYGGVALHHRLKPLMIGLVAGAVVAATVPMVVGALFYFATGQPPVPMRWSVW